MISNQVKVINIQEDRIIGCRNVVKKFELGYAWIRNMEKRLQRIAWKKTSEHLQQWEKKFHRLKDQKKSEETKEKTELLMLNS